MFERGFQGKITHINDMLGNGFDFIKCLNMCLNPVNPELNPICYLLALLGAHDFLHVSMIRVNLLAFPRFPL